MKRVTIGMILTGQFGALWLVSYLTTGIGWLAMVTTASSVSVIVPSMIALIAVVSVTAFAVWSAT